MKLFSEKIARELAEGKRIADTEVIILLLDQMNKRMDIMNESLNRRIYELRGDLRLPHQEVSSVKSDVMNLLEEKIGRS